MEKTTQNEPVLKPRWVLVQHMAFDRQHRALYRDNALGLQMEQYTPARRGQTCGKTETYYYIDNDPREFRTIEALMAARLEQA